MARNSYPASPIRVATTNVHRHELTLIGAASPQTRASSWRATFSRAELPAQLVPRRSVAAASHTGKRNAAVISATATASRHPAAVYHRGMGAQCPGLHWRGGLGSPHVGCSSTVAGSGALGERGRQVVKVGLGCR